MVWRPGPRSEGEQAVNRAPGGCWCHPTGWSRTGHTLKTHSKKPVQQEHRFICVCLGVFGCVGGDHTDHKGGTIFINLIIYNNRNQ